MPVLTAAQLSGILPAIPTPVKADDSVDENAVKALFAWLLKQGIDGVVPLGGTGEYGALSRTERSRMARLSVDAMGGRAPVIAGVLDTGFHDALDAGKDLAAQGVDGLLVLTPYYTNPTQAGIRDYCDEEAAVIASEPRVKTFFDRDLKRGRFEGETWTEQAAKIVVGTTA